jgi:hypothetical protein
MIKAKPTDLSCSRHSTIEICRWVVERARGGTNHAWKLPLLFTLVIGVAMLLLGVGMNVALARWGGSLGLSDRTDPATLPVAIAVFSIIFFALTPQKLRKLPASSARFRFRPGEPVKSISYDSFLSIYYATLAWATDPSFSISNSNSGRRSIF